jgi:hypothetical protein
MTTPCPPCAQHAASLPGTTRLHLDIRFTGSVDAIRRSTKGAASWLAFTRCAPPAARFAGRAHLQAAAATGPAQDHRLCHAHAGPDGGGRQPAGPARARRIWPRPARFVPTGRWAPAPACCWTSCWPPPDLAAADVRGLRRHRALARRRRPGGGGRRRRCRPGHRGRPCCAARGLDAALRAADRRGLPPGVPESPIHCKPSRQQITDRIRRSPA